MKTMIKTISIMAILVTTGLLNSCKKQLNQQPLYGLNASVVYGDPDNYINVLAKLYAGLSVTGLEGPAGKPDIAGIDEGFSAYVRLLFKLQELPTDEAICGWNDPGIPDLNKMTWSAENSFSKAMYYRIYYQVTLCNEFIRESSEEKMTERGFSDANKATIRIYRNEARFLRALSYYHAMDLFGNVPFVTEEDKVGAFQPERITRADLFQYIESELLDMEDQLLVPFATPYGRASQAAAQFLLAKMYLNASVYNGTNRAASCAEYCQKILNANAYTLDDSYPELFMADNNTSPEIIFPVCYDGLFTQTYGGTTFMVNASIGGLMTPADYGTNGKWAGLRAKGNLVDKFPDSTQDSRYQFYRNGQVKEITAMNVFAQGYALPKYKNKTSTGLTGSNNGTTPFVDIDFPMFRLAEVYLMYAEAALRGGGDVSLGLSYVNNLRERAYGNSSSNLSSISLNDILDERARELHWECTRRTDLIRFDLFTSGSYLWPFKGGVAAGTGVSDHLKLYALPTADLNLNPNLIQNPGY
jgi:hypothetical protein